MTHVDASKISDDTLPAQGGIIATLLLKDGLITEQQLSYALRVRTKLASPKTVKDTLIDLGYVSPQDIQQTLNKNQINVRLGDILVELGYLRENDLKQALAIQKDSKGEKRLGEVLIEGGFIEERKLLETLSYQLGYPLIELNFVKLDRSLFTILPLKTCREYGLSPVAREGDTVVVAFSDPLDSRAREIVDRKS